MEYFKAEIYRNLRNKGYLVFIFIMTTIVTMITLYIKLISPFQKTQINSGEVYFILFNFFMMGIFIAFPIITSAYSGKSIYIKQQIISNNISNKKVVLSDSLTLSIINSIMFVLINIITIMIVYFIFGNNPDFTDKDSFTILKFIYVQSIMLFAILSLTIQADCIQKTLNNKVLANGLFVFIGYILPIMIFQLRFFSNIIMKISRILPMGQIVYGFRGETSVLEFIVVISLNIIIPIILCVLRLNCEEY